MKLELMTTNFIGMVEVKKGRGCFLINQHIKIIRVSIIGALNRDAYLKAIIIANFLKHMLKMPILKPGQTIILDNVSFHKKLKN